MAQLVGEGGRLRNFGSGGGGRGRCGGSAVLTRHRHCGEGKGRSAILFILSGVGIFNFAVPNLVQCLIEFDSLSLALSLTHS